MPCLSAQTLPVPCRCCGSCCDQFLFRIPTQAADECGVVGQLDRKALEAAAKAKDVAVAPDGTLEAFTAALEGAEGLDKLQPTSMCALALHCMCEAWCLLTFFHEVLLRLCSMSCPQVLGVWAICVLLVWCAADLAGLVQAAGV